MKTVHFYYDLVDPASRIMLRRLLELGLPDEVLVVAPFELRPPSQPMLDAADPGWLAWWDRFGADAGGPAAPHDRIPRTRKAHEFLLHASEKGLTVSGLRHRLFDAALVEGRDIGRIDVLVGFSSEAGLDLTEAKAVLDVDRHAEQIEQVRSDAEGLGVRGVPTLVVDGERLEGVHDVDTIREFLSGFDHS